MFLLILTSCGNTQYVSNNRGIQKRKYTKGLFVNGRSNFKTGGSSHNSRKVVKIIPTSDPLELKYSSTPCDTFYMKDGTIQFLRAGNKGRVLMDVYDCVTGKRKQLKNNDIQSIGFAEKYEKKESQSNYQDLNNSCDTIYMIDGTKKIVEFVKEGSTVLDVKPCKNGNENATTIRKLSIRKIVHDNGYEEDYTSVETRIRKKSKRRGVLMVLLGALSIPISLILFVLIAVYVGEIVAIVIGALLIALAIALIIYGSTLNKRYKKTMNSLRGPQLDPEINKLKKTGATMITLGAILFGLVVPAAIAVSVITAGAAIMALAILAFVAVICLAIFIIGIQKRKKAKKKLSSLEQS